MYYNITVGEILEISEALSALPAEGLNVLISQLNREMSAKLCRPQPYKYTILNRDTVPYDIVRVDGDELVNVEYTPGPTSNTLNLYLMNNTVYRIEGKYYYTDNGTLRCKSRGQSVKQLYQAINENLAKNQIIQERRDIALFDLLSNLPSRKDVIYEDTGTDEERSVGDTDS